MATYKVLQDIEAEDKLLGPLTLKQFIYACIAAAIAFVAFMFARISIYFIIPFLPFIGVFVLLAAPLSKDQTTEVWLAAQIRFLIKPRKRIWDQNGIKELVTITAPKKVQKVFTKNYSEQEVRSRLRALTDMIDSRGWAVKNVNLNLYSPPALADEDSDRLIDYSNLPQNVPDIDINAADDIMDYQNNPVAQQFEKMVQEASEERKQQAIDKMQKIKERRQQEPEVINDYQASYQQKAEPEITKEQSEALLAHVKQEHDQAEMIKPHHKNIKTPEQIEEETKAQQKAEQTQADSPLKNPAIMEYANTNDLTVASLQHLVNRQPKPTNEVVVHLR